MKPWGSSIAVAIGGCQVKQTLVRHVLIAYPEHWNDGDRRPCFWGPPGGSTVSGAVGQPNLPQLDCESPGFASEDTHMPVFSGLTLRIQYRKCAPGSSW